MPTAAEPASATRLSYRRASLPLRSGRIPPLARVSLAAVLLSMSSGCLIEDPPPYPQPAQTPPRLDLRGATPPLDQVIVRTRGNPIIFSMPVASEDAGDSLFGVLLLDYSGPGTEDLLSVGVVPPSTLDDTERALTLSWTVRPGLTPGCHRFTLRVSHQSNFLNLPNVRDPRDVAEAYWWANLDPETPSDTLANCPLASSGTP